MDSKHLRNAVLINWEEFVAGIWGKKWNFSGRWQQTTAERGAGTLSWAGLCSADSRALAALGGCAERALAKRCSWQAGMCYGSTAGFYRRAGQGWETGYVLSQEQEGRSAATPWFTLWELAPCWSHFSVIGTQFLDITYHNSSASAHLFAYFILPCL